MFPTRESVILLKMMVCSIRSPGALGLSADAWKTEGENQQTWLNITWICLLNVSVKISAWITSDFQQQWWSYNNEEHLFETYVSAHLSSAGFYRRMSTLLWSSRVTRRRTRHWGSWTNSTRSISTWSSTCLRRNSGNTNRRTPSPVNWHWSVFLWR